MFLTQTAGGLLSTLMPSIPVHPLPIAAMKTEHHPPFRTSLCEIFGIRYPIFQAGMGNVAGPELVAAVSNAGGLGILPATMMPPEEVRRSIRQVRQLTSRPFGVNLLLQEDMFPPRDFDLSADVVRDVHAILNPFRLALGIPPVHAAPPRLPPLIEQAFEVLLEENVPVLSIGMGNPSPAMVARCHAQGMKVMAMVATPADAMTVAAAGVDAVVAQGSEAGGHRSTWQKKENAESAGIGLFALLPAVVARVQVPVLAAGGIADGRGVVAALELGAQGVLIGTRFAATRESLAPACYKQKLLDGGSDDTTITDAFTGMYARVLRNRFTETYRQARAPVLPPGRQFAATADIVRAAAREAQADYYPLYAGQGIDLIRHLLPAGEVVDQLVAEVRSAGKASGSRRTMMRHWAG